MNQKTTNPDVKPVEEVEDFVKIVKSSTGQLAIVDASVLRDLQNPLASEAVILSTKQTPGQEVYFKVVGKYDDAILREMTMSPATTEEVSVHQEKQDDKEAVNQTKEKINEGIQLHGHDRANGSADPVAKTINRISSIASKDGRPNKADRGNRNDLNSAHSRPAVSPVATITGRMAEKGSHHGAENDNYGQLPGVETKKKPPEPSPVAAECTKFFELVKNKTISDEFIGQMRYFDVIHRQLSEMRKLPNKHSDLIHESYNELESYRMSRLSIETKLIEDLIKNGIPIDEQ